MSHVAAADLLSSQGTFLLSLSLSSVILLGEGATSCSHAKELNEFPISVAFDGLPQDSATFCSIYTIALDTLSAGLCPPVRLLRPCFIKSLWVLCIFHVGCVHTHSSLIGVFVCCRSVSSACHRHLGRNVLFEGHREKGQKHTAAFLALHKSSIQGKKTHTKQLKLDKQQGSRELLSSGRSGSKCKQRKVIRMIKT